MVQKPTVLPYLSQSLLRWPLVNIYCNKVLKLLLKLEAICLKAWTCTWKAQYNEKFLKWNNFWYCFLWSSHLGFALPWLFFFCQSLSACWRRQRPPTPVLWPGKSHGWRSLVGCSPWGRKKSDMTKRLHFHFSLSCIGEGNGNPLQCFCLENPRDGGAWWAAVYGVAESDMTEVTSQQ